MFDMSWIQWVFSGIGVTVLTVGIPWALKTFKGKRDLGRSESVPTQKPETRTVDYFSRVVKVKKGEYIDLPKFGMTRTRLTLKDIELPQSDKPQARLVIDGGGSLFSCGSLAEEVGTNEFLLRSRKHGEEEEWSAFKFFTHERALHFFRVFVTHINPHDGYIELNVVQLHTRYELTTMLGRQ